MQQAALDCRTRCHRVLQSLAKKCKEKVVIESRLTLSETEMKIDIPYRIIFVIAWLSYSICSPILLGAQDNELTIKSLLASGDSLFALKKLDDATKNYQAALKIEKNNSRALTGIGKIAIAQKNWSDAGDAFQTVLDNDPDNPEANYYRGIAYRETGKFKALLLRKLDWKKSEQHFKKVIARDSLYQDIIYQFAILERYHENYIGAILLGQRQIQLRPDLIEPQVKLFRLYRYFITHTKKNQALNWLRQQDNDHANYASAEKLRREKELTTSDSLLQDLQRRPRTISRQPGYLSLARIHYEQGDDSAGENYYWRAVNKISDAVDADLIFEDVKYIITDQELLTYRSLKTIQEKQAFFQKLWTRRDPTPAASINHRLAEHYRRLIYAEKYYEHDGFRSWFNNPDKQGYLEFTEAYDLNEEFHDKGLIYIRHGDPNERATSVNETSPSNESWLYYQTQFNPQMTFHFLVDNNSVGYWRLTPFITDPALLEDRLTWDNIYYQMLRATDLERQSMIQAMAESSRKAVAIGLATDRHTWEKNIKPLDIPFSISTFRGKQSKTIIEICYAIALRELGKEAKKKNSTIEIERGLAIHQLGWDVVAKKQDQIRVSFPAGGAESFLDCYRFEVAPDSYRFAFYARPKDSDYLGGWKFEKQIASYSTSNLRLSDIELATRIEPTATANKFTRNGLLVIPNPTRLFASKTPIYVYFEIYSLSQDAFGRTSFAIDYTLTRLESQGKGVWGLFRSAGKSSISTQINREGDSEFSVEYLAIDASQVRAGEYHLEITVTDRLTGATAKSTRRLALN